MPDLSTFSEHTKWQCQTPNIWNKFCKQNIFTNIKKAPWNKLLLFLPKPTCKWAENKLPECKTVWLWTHMDYNYIRNSTTSNCCLFQVVKQNLGIYIYKDDGKVETIMTWWLITQNTISMNREKKLLVHDMINS